MTKFEAIYRLLLTLEHPLYQRVHRTLRELPGTRVLDVGGRRSNYTIGLAKDVQILISDIPREAAIQEQLDLGATDEMRARVLRRRSNVSDYIYDDMTRTALASGSSDIVVSVEVLEHVEEDELFVANVARVLKSGGYFLMTTPNGNFRPVPFADHKRHYKAADLEALLRRHFPQVTVEFCVNSGWLFNLGYKMPLPIGMWAYGLSSFLERFGFGGRGPMRKLHLFALCKK